MKGIKNLVTQLHQGRTRWVHSPGLEAKPLCQRNKNGGPETERPSVSDEGPMRQNPPSRWNRMITCQNGAEGLCEQ